MKLQKTVSVFNQTESNFAFWTGNVGITTGAISATLLFVCKHGKMSESVITKIIYGDWIGYDILLFANGFIIYNCRSAGSF